jgi:hypothetical protein
VNPVKESDRLPVDEVAPSDTSVSTAPVDLLSTEPKKEMSQLRPEDQRNLDIIQQLQSRLELAALEKETRAEAAKKADRYAAYSVSESRSFDFKVRTAEGDEVDVRISAAKVGSAEYARNGDASSLVIAGEQESSLMFSVKGDLNEEELQAINDLLAKVGDVSSAFFDGKFNQAFDLASNLGLDGDQIQSFALNLRMTKTEQASLNEGLYTPKIVGRGAERNQMAEVASLFDSVGTAADKLQISRSLVADLIDYVAQQTHPENPRKELLGPLAHKLL